VLNADDKFAMLLAVTLYSALVNLQRSLDGLPSGGSTTTVS
jgi:hypothetical protein